MLRYKIDVLKELKEKGFDQITMVKGKMLSSETVSKIRHGNPAISCESLNRICIMLRCQPSDIFECIPSDEEKIKFF